MANQNKFRPYFTLPELEELIRCLKVAPTIHPSLLRSLELFKLKSSQGLISPQYTLAPSMQDKLGLSDPPPSDSTPESLYTKWKSSPESLTLRELDKVQQYRYAQNLMTPAEEPIYEAGLFTRSDIAPI